MLDRIGQLFITGYDGRKPSREFLDFFKAEALGGVILFEENVTPHRAAEETIRTLASISPAGLPFVAVDQEGGRVCRGILGECDIAETCTGDQPTCLLDLAAGK